MCIVCGEGLILADNGSFEMGLPGVSLLGESGRGGGADWCSAVWLGLNWVQSVGCWWGIMNELNRVGDFPT